MMGTAEVAGAPLFLTRSTLGDVEKTAMHKLNRDPAKWDQEIMSFLHEQNPYLQDFDIRIHMNKTDPEAGMGVGQIVINDKIAIPIIIENSRLFPLDLFWHEDGLHPMTKPALLGAVQTTTIGKAIEPGQGEISDVSLYGAVRPPFSGKYSFADSLMFTEDDLNEALSVMGPEALDYALRTNETFKEALADYTLAVKNPEEMKKVAERECISIDDFEMIGYQEVEDPGVYTVVVDGFRKTAAFVFDMVIDWDENLIEGKKTILDLEESRGISLQESLGGIPLSLHEGFDKIAMAEQPRSGDIGFYWFVKEGHAIATLPVKVEYTGSGDDFIPFTKVSMIGLEEQQRTIYQAEDYSGFSKIGDNIFMSPEWRWIRCGAQCKVADAETANKLDWPDNTIEVRNEGSIFYLDGLDIDGISKAGEGRKGFEDALAAILDRERVAQIMKTAEERSSVFFTYSRENVTKTAEIEKQADLIKAAKRHGYDFSGGGPNDWVHQAAFIVPCERYEFFKFAAEIDKEKAKSTIDSVLSLNFVTSENIYKFVEKTDVLEDALDTLAKLLLAARLGLDIEQAPLRTAMFAMDEVVRQLKSLGSQVYGEEE